MALSAAGGFSPQAEKGQVNVRFANGEVRTRHRSFLSTSNPQPHPGSEVYVPLKDPGDKGTDYVQVVGSIAQILMSAIAIIVVVRR